MTARILAPLAAALRFAEAVGGRLAWLPPTAARVVLGVVFVGAGWGKLHDLERVTAFFQSLGVPAPGFHAPFVSGIELVGGLLLLAGLATRFAAVPLLATMVVALVTARAGEIAGASDLFVVSEFLLAALLGWLAVAGAGPLSLDHVVLRLVPCRSGSEEAAWQRSRSTGTAIPASRG